jgi:flagellar assembly factor FliW
MPTLHIQETDLHYEENDIITFSEGLIGFPHFKQMVLVRQSSVEPLFWLASPETEGDAFLVADAHSIFPAYSPSLPAGSAQTLPAGESPVVLAIVLVANEWEQSTANLRAPLFISPGSMRGVQVALPDNYSVVEPLPLTA